MDNECKKQINALALAYRDNRTNKNFESLYHAMEPQRLVWRRATRGCVDPADVDSMFNYLLYRDALTYDPSKGDFVHRFNKRMRQRKIDLMRGSLRRLQRTEPRKRGDNSVCGTAILHICSTEINPEDAALEKEQRQLLSSMVSESDELTKLIVSNYSLYDSQNALAKGLGIHHEVVKRKLQALSRNFRR